MSNIDNHFANGMANRTVDYARKENYTAQVKNFLEEFENVIPAIVKEYDDLEQRIKTKDCKAFKEKMDGLALLNSTFKEQHIQDLLYWYIQQPKQQRYEDTERTR